MEEKKEKLATPGHCDAYDKLLKEIDLVQEI